MSAKKATSRPRNPLVPPRMWRLLKWICGPGRTAALLALVCAAFCGAWYGVWQRVGPRVLAGEQYWLTRENVEITPPREWIHRDIRAEVFRDASLDGPLSILDDDLVSRIAGAFSLHPWVAKVHRVTKHHPARVRVELEYRRPVCMVEVPGGLLPVDAEGVLLPSGDFSPLEARRYPRLVGIRTVPIGPVGTRWGDASVVGGAEVAAVFDPRIWQKLGLKQIVPSTPVQVGYDEQYTYELVTRGGTRIFWGRAPGTLVPGEPPAADKVAWLITYYEENSSLEGNSGPQRLDLRTLAGPQDTPRPPVAAL